MNWMGYLQQLGRSLMIPTIALPVAAVFLSLGALPWESAGLGNLGSLFVFSGDMIFTYLPFMFAVGVALGLTSNAGIAGLSALLSYFLLTQITQTYMQPQLQMGVTGGIVIGILTALSYHRFSNIQLPEYIQYFGGPRFVPIFVGTATIFLSLVIIAVGPAVEQTIEWLGEMLLSLGGFGAFIYGTAYRLLVPSGLHHILNNVYWFQIGTFERADGTTVFGDLPRFFAGDPEAGIFMAGLYPIMMFALPAIALAIIQEAREDLKPKIRKTFLTAALACFLTGVTEPIEFAFLFVAPVLFFIHSILSGLSMWIAYELGIHHGFSFSAGLLEFIINGHLSTRGLWLIPIGLVFGITYYVLFRWAIRRFQLPTPGREEGSPLEEWAGDIRYRSPLILQALGGKNNIKTIEACITRLRLTLQDDKLIDTAALKHLGAAGVIRLGGGNVQVVFGTFSELIREEIIKVTRTDLQQVLFSSPVQGRMIPLDEVPDQVFSRKIVGNGVAFIPERGELVAPVAGKVIHIYPTMHAIGLQTENGLDVLLHIGIDTVQLQGKGKWFTAVVQEGDEVIPGQLLVKFNLTKVRQNAKSLATPMLITNAERIKSWSFAPFKAVKKGQGAVMSVVLKEEAAAVGGQSDD
ncbi:glucose PTS transporter subunit IIA [Paenibacillus sp. J2TS4]|uniref:glucose PTS transporter subunit IIA n=1 Tax=Paenibacillus sp. J2TS4 TaxID=2807194 RepID=UPI001B2EB910|nr:glucose PTS transporter subunit IIA [Paenibacillus sp. J2TS4]GIP32890.1 putative PTS system glucosamine-specific EIICBA component [Paenibacillus sp. J2TS4]